MKHTSHFLWKRKQPAAPGQGTERAFVPTQMALDLACSKKHTMAWTGIVAEWMITASLIPESLLCAPDLVLELSSHAHSVLATTFKQVLLCPTYRGGHRSIHLFPQRGTGSVPNSGELSKGFRSPVYCCSSLGKKAVS